jgi:hypothetical protein
MIICNDLGHDISDDIFPGIMEKKIFKTYKLRVKGFISLGVEGFI